jgi:hypothetical protein
MPLVRKSLFAPREKVGIFISYRRAARGLILADAQLPAIDSRPPIWARMSVICMGLLLN